MTPEEEWLASFGLTEEVTAQELERAGGAAGAGAAAALEGLVPIFGKQVREAVQSPELREQQRADYPIITTIGELVGGIPLGVATSGASRYLAGPTASALKGALTAAGVEGGLSGATAAAKGGDWLDVALSSLIGGGLGAAGGGAGAKVTSSGKQLAKEQLLKDPKYIQQIKQTDRLSDKLVESERKLRNIEAELQSEKIGLRTTAEKNLKTLKSDIQKSQKDLDALRVKVEKAPPPDKTSPEYQAWQQAKDDVKRLQRQLDSSEADIRKLEATAPTKLGKEREQRIAAAERDVAKAEERVFSAEEKAELDDALLKVMRGREEDVAAAGKARAKNRRIAEQRAKMQAEAEAPSPAPVEEPIPEFGRAKELTPRQIELLEDLVASGKSLRDIGSTVPGRMNKDTLSRRLKAYGITPESAKANVAARAEQKAALEAAAQDIVPDRPMPEFVPVPKVGRDILSKADKRRLLQAEELSPIRQEAELGRLTRAQQGLERAQAPIPSLAESRFATEMATKQEQANAIRAELSKAMQIRDDALSRLQNAQPEAQPALQRQYQNAERALGDKAQEYDDALKALEEEQFAAAAKKEPIVQAERQNVAIDRQLRDQAQEVLAQMQNVSPGVKSRLMSLGAETIVRAFSGPAVSELTDKDVEAVLTDRGLFGM